MDRVTKKWKLSHSCIFIIVIFLCANVDHCLDERGKKTDSPIPIVLWHGMGEFIALQ